MVNHQWWWKIKNEKAAEKQKKKKWKTKLKLKFKQKKKKLIFLFKNEENINCNEEKKTRKNRRFQSFNPIIIKNMKMKPFLCWENPLFSVIEKKNKKKYYKN